MQHVNNMSGPGQHWLCCFLGALGCFFESDSWYCVDQLHNNAQLPLHLDMVIGEDGKCAVTNVQFACVSQTMRQQSTLWLMPQRKEEGE